MRIALLSDIHSNLQALQSVLEDIRQSSPPVDSIWFLGDLIGYGAQPYQVWKALIDTQKVRHRILGNQDAVFAGKMKATVFHIRYESTGAEDSMSDYFNGVALDAIEKNMDALTGESQVKEWFREIEFWERPLEGIVMAHGAVFPDDGERMLRASSDNGATIEDQYQAASKHTESAGAVQLIIVGHTHRQVMWRREAGQSAPQWIACVPNVNEGDSGTGSDLDPSSQVSNTCQEAVIDLQPDGELFATLLNPGSVGFPRDGIRAGDGWAWAKYAVLDWSDTKKTVRFRQVPYKVERTLYWLQLGRYPQAIMNWLTGARNPST